jgi:hypothetical protein
MAAPTPASSRRRFKAGERPQATRAASSPPREASDLHHDEGKAATGGIEAAAAV